MIWWNKMPAASLTSTNLLYMRKRKESNLLLCRALGHSPESKRQDHNHFCLRCTPIHEQLHTCQSHTLVNVEFLQESEDLFGEQFGLDLAHALFGQRDARESPVEKHTRTQDLTATHWCLHTYYRFPYVHTCSIHAYLFHTEAGMAPQV